MNTFKLLILIAMFH